MRTNIIYEGDANTVLREIPRGTIQSCITSPPYWGLRDYLNKDQVGMEESPSDYIDKLLCIFGKIYDCLKDDGLLFVVIGDCYAGSGKTGGNPNHPQFGKVVSNQLQGLHGKVPDGCKPKDMVGIPWMLAFALRDQGWYLRSDIIWHKPNPMPLSVKDRCTSSHEHIFMLSKESKYYYDAAAIATEAKDTGTSKPRFGGTKYTPSDTNSTYSGNEYNNTGKANRRDVWTIPVSRNKTSHKAPFPEAIVDLLIKCSTREGDIVLDPFMGSGTTAVVAKHLNRKYIGIELNPDFIVMANERIKGETM